MTMKSLNLFFCLACLLLASACGNGSGDELAEKKATLEEKRKQLEQLNADIIVLEKEILALDPNFATQNIKKTLVTTLPVKSSDFTSYLEVQGTVESDNNVILSAETNGIVRNLLVKEGQFVGQGQLLVSQSSEVLQSSIAEVEKSLELAEVVFKRQSNLWEQRIGTELQYLEAKNNKERLERQLQTLRSQVGMANITAPFSGVVDEIFIRQGQNAGPGTQVLRLVNTQQVNVVAEVSETYLGKVKVGDLVKVDFPSLDKSQEAPISLIGQTINPENRTFRIEIQLTNPERTLKPDLLATVRIQEAKQADAIVIPTNLIQKDKAGEFVFVLDQEGKKQIARKVRVQRGDTYDNQTVILEGLQGDELLIDRGSREVADGSNVELSKQSSQNVAQAKK